MSTPKDYSTAKAEYITGNMSIRDLARTRGLSVSVLMKRSARDGWQLAREQYSRDVAAKAEALMLDRGAEELAKFNADDLKVAKSLRLKAVRMLEHVESPLELRALAVTLEKAQRMGRLALGASTDNQTLFGRDGGPIQQEAVSAEELAEACRSARDKF